VLDKNCYAELRHIIELQLKDNSKARLIIEDQSNPYKKSASKKTYRAQMDTYKYLKGLLS